VTWLLSYTVAVAVVHTVGATGQKGGLLVRINVEQDLAFMLDSIHLSMRGVTD